MLELLAGLTVLGLLAALFLLAGFVLKVVFTVLLWPFKTLFWLLGGLFSLIVLPFQLLGGLLMLLVLVPLAIAAVPLVLGIGIPLILVGVVLLPVLLVVALGCWIVGAIFA